MKMSRRAALGAMLGGIASAAFAQSAPVMDTSPFPVPRPLGFHTKAIPSGHDLVAASRVSGVVSYAVADVASGEVLESRGALRRLPPASVAKSVTAVYALETLGGDFRFATDVFATGPIEDGVVQGNLILVGGGDPTLDTDGLGALAETLVAAGITGVSGQFYVYGGALPKIDMIDDEQTEYAGYNPTISGVNLNYNRVHFEWKKEGEAYNLKLDARAKKFAPDVTVAKMRIEDRAAPVFDYEPGQGRDDWSVARSALGSEGARWLPVRLPELYAGEVFRAVAKAQGLALPKARLIAALPKGDAVFLVAQQQSAPLSLIVRDMLKYSTNLTAEAIGLTASLKRGAAPTDLVSSAAEMSKWAAERLSAMDMSFVDHSGLGVATVVSVSDMVRMLTTEGVEALIGPLLKTIPVRGEKGAPDPHAPTEVVAKTGTLSFVSTLAGYITAPDGTRLAFGVFAADLPARVIAKASGEEVPRGARTFSARARALQQAMIKRWSAVYGT